LPKREVGWEWSPCFVSFVSSYLLVLLLEYLLPLLLTG